jgi:two-component system, OmpR family, KDP operon response regulator KdpE
MARRATILVVDDDPGIRRLLHTSLQAMGYRVLEAGGGHDGLAAFDREQPDLLVLDLGLPDLDGTEVIHALRRHSKVPIIVLSVRDEEQSKVEAFDLGADDYVTKPFGFEELVARIHTALRHRLQEEGQRSIFVAGDLSIDLVRRSVKRGSQEVHLTPKEYDVLAELVANADRPLSYRHMLARVWGPDHLGDAQYLRVFIRNLRNKLEPDPARPRYILTESGIGYRLRGPS